MHFPKDINEDGCQCNEEEGWMQIPDRPFECFCTRDFVNEDGYCVNCEQLFDGCSTCVPEFESK